MTDVTSQTHSEPANFEDVFALLKPRVMSLVVFTAAIGLLVAPVGVNPVLAFASILFIALGAGASGALNMWWDADIDQVMKRTEDRPVPAGRVSPTTALQVGLWLSGVAVVMLGLASNWFAAGFLAFTIFFYAVVYSMWLKRSTPQNIVIGGASGAFPPMIGWAVATGGVSIESILMFALIFIWTPPHFWSLSMFMNDDYSRAGVPMMTVTHGRPYTRRQIVYYSLALAVVAVLIGFSSIGGPLYTLAAVVLSALFVIKAFALLRDENSAVADKYLLERKMFRFSLLYLFTLFSALGAEAVFRSFDLVLAGWPVWV